MAHDAERRVRDWCYHPMGSIAAAHAPTDTMVPAPLTLRIQSPCDDPVASISAVDTAALAAQCLSSVGHVCAPFTSAACLASLHQRRSKRHTLSPIIVATCCSSLTKLEHDCCCDLADSHSLV